jgi:hypothetical protein
MGNTIQSDPAMTSASSMVFPTRTPPGHAARAGLAFAFSTTIAFGMSLQFLAQSFVWRNWSIRELFDGWL